MKLLKKTLIATSIFLIAGFFSACSDSEEEGNSGYNQSSVIPAVEAVKSRFGSLPLVERFSGNVRSENQVALFPEITARVEEVLVDNGDYVEKGQTLIRLNDDQIRQQLQQADAGLKISRAQLKQAEASLGELNAQFKRTKQLADKNLSSDLELEQLQAQVASAEADVELAKAQLEQSEALVEERRSQLDRTLIKAPISGNVGQRNAEVGMMASPSAQLFLIGDLSKLRVEIVLTESMLNKINTGQRARILTSNRNGDEEYIDAEISRISPFLNEVTRSTEGIIEVDNRDGLLKPGMFVPVDVYFGESQQATLIPTSALFTDPETGKEGIFVATSMGTEIQPVSDSGNTSNSGSGMMTEATPVEFKPIEVIARGRMELGVAGIESGKWIVTMGQDLLTEGRKQARVRTMSWERIIKLQNMQREDLLDEIMNKNKGNNTPSVSM